MKSIALIGFMGSGKSTVAELLSVKTGMELFETDDEVLLLSGKKSINGIFETEGEEYFRILESQAINNAILKQGRVISCGGGVVENSLNMNRLKENTIIIYLNSSFQTISNRLAVQNNRPLFKDKGKAYELYLQRNPQYHKYASFTIDTDLKNPEEIVKQILNLLEIKDKSKASNVLLFSSETKISLVIGNPISHSLSPLMHQAGYNALGIQNMFGFFSSRVNSEELPEFIQRGKLFSIKALAVTIPFKEKIIPLLDYLHPDAKEIGAVNTVLNSDNKLTGYNTDWRGGMNALLCKIGSVKRKHAAILGSGGTARAIIYGLMREDCRINVFCRNREKGKELSGKFDCTSFAWERRNNATDSEIVINTIPMGKINEDSPLIPECILKQNIIFDVNYTDKDTPLIKTAKMKNALTIEGREMLLQQGLVQFELITGLKAPELAMRTALNLPK